MPPGKVVKAWEIVFAPRRGKLKKETEKACMAGRTKNASRNIVWSIVNWGVSALLPFVVRTCLIRTLGASYAGLNGLFTSIIQMLNMAELGFSSALIFSMYKPLAENDTEKVCALLALYRKVYRIIGAVILAVGLALIPFLPRLIHGAVPDDINLTALFLVSLADTSVSYWLYAYRESLLYANQRHDKISRISLLCRLLLNATQLLLLFATRNYYAYACVTPVFTILRNLIVYRTTLRLYPQYACRGKLPADFTKDIWKKVAGLSLYKISGVTRNAFDSLVISAYLGLQPLAVYQNYYLLLNSVNNLLSRIDNAVTASIGNAIASETVEKNYSDFMKLFFLYGWMGSVLTVFFYGLYQPFMVLWMGEKMMLSFPIVICFCAYFFMLMIGNVCFIYRQAAGLWWEDRVRPVLSSVLNITLNILLVKYFGVAGVLLSTIICLVTLDFGLSARVLFRKYFKKPLLPYFLQALSCAAVTALSCFAAGLICDRIPLGGTGKLIANFAVCAIVSNVFLFLAYFRTKLFQSSLKLVTRMIRRNGK